MLHSFFSSRFYSFTIVGAVAFAVAAVLMMGFLHGKVQRTFLDAMRTYNLQGMSILCQMGGDSVDSQLSRIEQEMQDMSLSYGRILLETKGERRERLLAGLVLHSAEARSFFFQGDRYAADRERVPDCVPADALEKAWNGSFNFAGPSFDKDGNYILCALMPCMADGIVNGVLGAQLNAYALSQWIRRLSPQGEAGFAYLFDRAGHVLASSAEDSRKAILEFYLAEKEGRRSARIDEMRLLQSVARNSGSGAGSYVTGSGSYVWEGEKIHLAYRAIKGAPWALFVGFEESALSRQVTRTAEKALQGTIKYFVLLVSVILIIVGMTLFDALRNRRLSLLLAEQNSTISRQTENLIASEKMFRYTLTQCSTQVIDYDVSSRMLTFYSGSRKDVFPVPTDDDWGVLLLRDKDISPEALSEIRALVRDVLAGAPRESCEFRLYDKARGKEQWHRLSLSGVSGEGRVLRRLIGIIEDISEAKEAEYDLLTRLYNRKSTEEMIRHQLKVRPSRQPYAFLLLDVDRFKTVNDSFGHPIGDRVLEATADLLRATFREEDILGRLGGDEFCVFLSGDHLEKSRLESALVALRTKSHDILKFPAGEKPLVSFSCGAVFSCSPHSFDKLYAVADEALYRVKEGGRDNFEIVVWDTVAREDQTS